MNRKDAAYHFVFTRQNRGKLDALTNLIERGLIKPVVGAVLPLARVGEAHELLEAGGLHGLRGKVAIDVVGQTVELLKRGRYVDTTTACAGDTGLFAIVALDPSRSYPLLVSRQMLGRKSQSGRSVHWGVR